MTIKKAVRRILAKEGRKQLWLADRIGITPVLLSQWLHSETLKLSSIERVAKALGTSASKLIALGE